MKTGEVVVLWFLVTVLACSYAATEAFPASITGDEEQRPAAKCHGPPHYACHHSAEEVKALATEKGIGEDAA